ILTAEPDELRGRGASALAEHVRGCRDCKAAGQRILNLTAALAEQVNSGASRSRRGAWPAWIALPLAASLAGLLALHTIGSTPALPQAGSMRDVKRPVVTPVVNAPPDRNVAVIKAADDIIIVWDLGGNGDL
ncbi:MAG TPA: hypothetical protein VK864_15070, partial [Longimicrobiales bacterium]|nr:hypothetical protein [Longimicrobiales bacterium]